MSKTPTVKNKILTFMFISVRTYLADVGKIKPKIRG